MKITIPPVNLDPPWSDRLTKAGNAEGQTGKVFEDMLAEVNKLQQQADTKVGQSLLGKTDLHEAMLDLEKATLSLKLLVQVRNKMIQAYEELSRMPL